MVNVVVLMCLVVCGQQSERLKNAHSLVCDDGAEGGRVEAMRVSRL